MKSPRPTLWVYLLGAAIGAVIYANLRALGAMALNDSLSWENALEVYSRIDLVPVTLLQAFGWFLIIGIPLFLHLRYRNQIKLWVFAAVGATLGAIASPALLVVPWTAMSAAAGAIAASCAFMLIHAL